MDFLWLLEGIRTPSMDKIMQVITYFGQELILVGIICFLYWCVNKKLAYQLGFTYFSAGLIVQTLKISFRIPRPWVLDPSFHAVESAVPDATGYSFPSGHTQGASSFFFPLFTWIRKKWLKVLCIFAPLCVGFSRMYLGCHTPKDVLASLGVSALCTWLIWHFRALFLEDSPHSRSVFAAMLIFSAGAAIYALLLLKNGIVTEELASDCCKAAGAGMGFAVSWYLERTRIRFSTAAKNRRIQAAKLICGLGMLLLIKGGVSFILGTSILAKMIEYFILILWIIVIYPAIFQKILGTAQET